MTPPDPLDTMDSEMPNPGGEDSQEGLSPRLTTINELNDEEAEGMDAYDDADMLLNLGNIDDVEMSTDSSKRKRIEEGEECNSHN